MSRFATIFTCLLALLVASPLCCCASELSKKEAAGSCCCCEGDLEKKTPDHDCACASNDPREMPDAALPHPGAGVTLSLQPACVWLPVVAETDAGLKPRWHPSLPWHAPPGERRAFLGSWNL